MRKCVPPRSGPTTTDSPSRRTSTFTGWLEGLEERRMLAATLPKLYDVAPRFSPILRSTPAVRVPLSPTPESPSQPLASGSTVTAAAADVATLAQPQTYSGALNGKVVYTSAGHGWQYNTTLGRYATDRGDNNEIVEDFGNQDQLSFYADYLLGAGATVVPMRPVGNQTNEVVLDNDSPGVTFTGAWSDSTSTHRYDEDYGAVADAVAYRTAGTTAGAETSVATYQPNIPVAGFYPVYAWALDGTNRTTQLYRVNHSGGSTEVRVDHRKVGKGWVYLGTYHFANGSSVNGNVQISNNSPVAGNVIADAIRFGNGMGDYVYTGSGATAVSGYPREDENSYHWIARSVGTGVSLATAIGSGTSNVSAPSNFAEWMNATPRTVDGKPSTEALYIGFHSNAGGGRGAVGLIDSDQFTPYQANLALFTGRQINADMQALNGQFEHAWSTRNPETQSTFGGGFGEIDLGADAEMDATIIEVGFHDSVEDAQLMRDPKVRDQMARSTYEATVEYFRSRNASQVTTSAPDDPTDVRAIANASGDVTISWTAPATRTNGPGLAAGYRVYTSRNGYGFGDPRVVNSGGITQLTIPAAELDGNAYYFRVAAFNAGGEGPASVVVGARKNGAGGGGGTNRVLVVNGFDRNERSQNQRYAYAHVADGRVDRVRPRYNNSFDYVVQAGEAVEAYLAGSGVALGFDSAQNEQVASNVVNLANYQTVIWLSGEESTANETFSSTEQSRVSNFVAGGGRLFVSGAEIGWDLDRATGPTGPTAGDVAFYNNTLKADFAADDAGTYTVSGTASSIFAGLSGITFDNGKSGFYDVDTPDRMNGFDNATPAMNYSTGTGAAAVQWPQNPGPGAFGPRVVNMGFPFEMITSAANRSAVMARVLNFFETAVSETPAIPDLVATSDSGNSNGDNITNRDNANASNTLEFLVAGTVAGATVNVYADGVLIGSAAGAAGTTTVLTNGTIDLLDGARSITARQQEPGKSTSPASAALGVTIDTVGPTADIVDVTPDPRTDGVPSVDVVFSEPVIGFINGDLILTRSGSGANLLTAEQNVTTADNRTFTVNNLGVVTAPSGEYTLAFAIGVTAPAVDLAGNGMTGVAGTNDAWVNNNPLPVVTDVFIGSTLWSPSFSNFLQTSAAGEAAFGYRLDATTQADELPWMNLDRISVRFSEDVDVTGDDLALVGVNTPAYANLAFAYDAASRTGTWTLPAGTFFGRDKLLLDLDAGPAGVRDGNGNALDGEWANPAPGAPGGADAFPSGDGSAGGDFRFRLNVLPGDVDGSGTIFGNDVIAVRDAQGSRPGGAVPVVAGG